MLLNRSVFKYFWGTTHPQNPQILLMKLKFHLLIIKKNPYPQIFSPSKGSS